MSILPKFNILGFRIDFFFLGPSKISQCLKDFYNNNNNNNKKLMPKSDNFTFLVLGRQKTNTR